MSTWLDTTTWLLLAADAPEFNLFNMMLPFLAIGLLFYFLMVRPERRKRAGIARMQDDLKKNDRIVTIGGIMGVVVNTQKESNEVTIRVDDNNNTRIHILRSSISRVLTDDKSDAKKEDG
ncbi:MAG: preprotein translocase subunit YajC [Planctomycetes bacterium]|nr:preprotein translocase subunit YajC [Planctomycetota bacterium]MBL7037147.1 preprotein translocase subunit YajC [Pirellulaceae bacterium]